ncbi:MAG: type IV pilin protein [Rubrivivax sp.]
MAGATAARRPARACRSGFTLIELCVVCAVVGLLATVAYPSLQDYINRSRRADAVVALTRVQLAQEAFMAHHGLYAGELAHLVGAAAPSSPEGRYRIALRGTGPTGYEAEARARPDGPMAADTACAVLLLRVDDGMAQFGPSPRCWNR